MKYRALTGITALMLALASILTAAVPAFATITGSPFNGADGVLDANAGTASNDLPTGNKTDDAFANGTKEDDVQINVGFGGIPPNKNDLLKLYVNGLQGTNGHTFLYLGWTRDSNTGDANIDFEFNKAQFSVGQGTDTLGRVAGDLLFLYDFGGSGTPTLAVFEWRTSGACSVSQDSAPCWGAAGAALVSEQSISADGLFGEAVVDLNASGLIPAGSCEAFQQAWAKARSSTSLTSTMKDFIAPGPANVNTCGATAAKKVDAQTGAVLSGATFTLKDSTNAVVGSGTTGSTGIVCVQGLNQGTYTWTETAAPPGYVIDTATQTVTINAVSSCPTTPFVKTFTDTAKGALAVKKVSDKSGNAALSGAQFSLKDSNNVVVGTVTTDANGLGCVANLVQGTYTWTETQAPPGFAIDTTSQAATLNAGSTCANTTNVTTFGDAPLTDITATAKSEATVGGSSTTITCKDSNNVNVGNSPQTGGNVAVGANGLKPGTYTCVLVIDP